MADERMETILAFVQRWIVPAGAVFLVLGTMWAVFRYTVAAEIKLAIQNMSVDVGKMQTQVSALETASGKTNDKIDTLLQKALERAFPAPQASKTKVIGSLKQAEEILRFARSENVKLDPQMLAEYGKQVAALSNDPHTSAVAWQTVATLLDYRSFLNVALAPTVGKDIVDTPAFSNNERQDFWVEINAMPLPGSGNLGWMRWGNVVRSNSPEAALFLKIGDEEKQNAASDHLLLEAAGYAIKLDGYHAKNIVIKDARIIYDGGRVSLENVYFVNCTFAIQHNRHVQDFANAVMTHVPVSFSPS